MPGVFAKLPPEQEVVAVDHGQWVVENPKLESALLKL
jgi:hypothetical protein